MRLNRFNKIKIETNWVAFLSEEQMWVYRTRPPLHRFWLEREQKYLICNLKLPKQFCPLLSWGLIDLSHRHCWGWLRLTKYCWAHPTSTYIWAFGRLTVHGFDHYTRLLQAYDKKAIYNCIIKRVLNFSK